MDRNDEPRDRKKNKDKTQVTPAPSRPDLFAFIEQLFNGSDQKPEKIELRQAFGPGARKYGSTVIQKEFKANDPKPTREKMVAISNELLDLAQHDCNEVGMPHKYGVLAKHYAKSDGYYSVFLLSLRPKQPADYDPNEVNDDEYLPSDARRRDMLLSYGLDHIKQGDEHVRWQQGQNAQTIAGLMERADSIMDKQAARIEHLEARFLDFFKAAEEALSKKQDRDMALESHQVKMGLLKHGAQTLMQWFPVVANHMMAKQAGAAPPQNGIEGGKSAESMALESFIETLSPEQVTVLFGEWDAEGKVLLKENGLFSAAQTRIIFGVANCQLPATEVDKLLEGELALTEQQMAKAPTILSTEQFMPLVAFVMSRKNLSSNANNNQSPPHTP